MIETNLKILLEKFPELKSNDRLLWLVYMNSYHNMKEQIKHSPDPYDTIKTILLDKNIPSIDIISKNKRRLLKKYISNKEVYETQDWFKGR